MGSPLSTLAICLSYVMLVKVWGPAYMKNRPAFQFRRTLVIYNAIQVIFSTWLFYEVKQTVRTNKISHFYFNLKKTKQQNKLIRIANGNLRKISAKVIECLAVGGGKGQMDVLSI
jgi:Na+/melibiose symporter-like transporter